MTSVTECIYCEAPVLDEEGGRTCVRHEFLADEERALCTFRSATGALAIDTWCPEPVTHVVTDEGEPWCGGHAPAGATPISASNGRHVTWSDVYALADATEEDDSPRRVRVLAKFLDAIGHPVGMAWPAQVAWAAGGLVLLAALAKVLLAVAR